MANKMTQFYVAVVEEVIKDTNDNPTMELRVRIPNMHSGLKTKDLPIALPMYTPGAVIDKDKFIKQIEVIRKVYVIFEYGNLAKPRYIGVPEFFDGSSIELNEPAESMQIVINDEYQEGTYVDKIEVDAEDTSGHTLNVTRAMLPDGPTGDMLIDIPLGNVEPDTTKFRVWFSEDDE